MKIIIIGETAGLKLIQIIFGFMFSLNLSTWNGSVGAIP